MHSAVLRGSDFKIKSDNSDISHTDFCSRFNVSLRLGVYTPDGIDGLGATNLILLFVTAFYDRLRSKSDDFHAYPDFYTFQCQEKLTDYGMLDIYPMEKNRLIQSGADALFDEVMKNNLNVLILPANNNFLHELSSKQISILQSKIDYCFLYAQNGEVEDSNLVIETNRSDISEWVEDVLMSSGEQDSQIQSDTNRLTQSFQEISFSL